MRTALGRALGGVALLVLLSLSFLQVSVEPERIRSLWAEARGLPLLLGGLLMFGGILFMGFRWKALLPGGERTSGFVLAAVDCTAQLVNVALPGPVGELVGAALVDRRYGIPAPVALAASLHGRVVGLSVAALGALGSWALFPLPIPGSVLPFAGAVAGLVAAGAAFLAALSARPHLLVRASAATLGRWMDRPRPLAGAAVRGHRLVVEFGDALVLLGRSFGRPHLIAAAWAVVGVAFVVAGDQLACIALGRAGSLPGLVFTHCTITAGAVLLFALPIGQIGWDAAFATLLVTAAGLDLPQALAVTVVVRVQQVLILVLGAAFLPWLFRTGGSGPGEAEPVDRCRPGGDGSPTVPLPPVS